MIGLLTETHNLCAVAICLYLMTLLLADYLNHKFAPRQIESESKPAIEMFLTDRFSPEIEKAKIMCEMLRPLARNKPNRKLTTVLKQRRDRNE